MKAIIWVQNHLNSQGIKYEHLQHRPASTAQEAAQDQHISKHRMAKTVVLMVDNRPMVAVLPATRHICLEQLPEQLKAETVRLASEAEIKQKFPDCEGGAVPALRHWNCAPLLADPSMKVEGDVLFNGGTHHDLIRIGYEDWLRVARPQMVHLAADADSEHACQCAHARAPAERVCATPRDLARLLVDLLDVLHLQAKEIERLSAHVEQHTRTLPFQSRIPLCVSEISELQTRLNAKGATDKPATLMEVVQS